MIKKKSKYKIDKKVEVLMGRFEDMITAVDKIELASNLEYVLSLQLVDRLEKSVKIILVKN